MKWTALNKSDDTARPVPIFDSGANQPFVVALKKPIVYFRDFFDKDLITLIVNESNRFSLQKYIQKLLFLEIM